SGSGPGREVTPGRAVSDGGAAAPGAPPPRGRFAGPRRAGGEWVSDPPGADGHGRRRVGLMKRAILAGLAGLLLGAGAGAARERGGGAGPPAPGGAGAPRRV